MDEKDFLNRITQSMNESQEESLRSLGRPSSCATREQAIKQVEMLEAAHSGLVQEDIKTDERGRIILTERMKNSLNKAQKSLEEGRCLNQEMFRKRFAKWLSNSAPLSRTPTRVSISQIWTHVVLPFCRCW